MSPDPTEQTDAASATGATGTATRPERRSNKGPRKQSTARINAATMAARLSKAHGRTVTAKQVRQWCRDNVTAYQDDGYTVHAYDAATVKRIESAWKGRTARRNAQSAR